MSWQASDHVRNLEGVSAMEKAVLYSLADRHNTDEHGCWPRLALIAKEAGMSESSVKRNLRALAGRGVIRISQRKRADGSQTTNFYSFGGLDDTSGEGVNLTPRGVRLDPLEPEENQEMVIKSEKERTFYEAAVQATHTIPGVHSGSYWKRSDAKWMDQVDLMWLRHAVESVRRSMGVTRDMTLPTPTYLPALSRLGEQLRDAELDDLSIITHVGDDERISSKILYGVAKHAGEIWASVVQRESYA